MLETRNLCKKYKPKKGVAVQAVDHISLRFPEKGMVFLLGKSGSGKSTMLNLLGGLDQYDEGEIIIKGISSKDFNQQRFDSYRNTYVGFIFQEYNVLEEFTVGANIALALELQGKKATDEELNRILHDVDLDGYGNRKPNELSGGQKQRVAIARALVKNPEIIMADEPTGALDSATGRQVLDTLKKLSAEKLVIVVSHDREYAEQYADRIIELADGKIIRDVEAVHTEAAGADDAAHPVYRATTIEIPAGYHLTEEDRVQINEYLDQLKSGATIALPSQMRGFRETDESQIPAQDGSKFSLIRSKLPMRSAFKIGCSSLKHKRFRLVMTILLSVAAFSMFALVDTFSAYDHIRACTDSLIDSGVNYVSVHKAIKHGEGMDEWWSGYGHLLSEQDLKDVTTDTGIPVTGMYSAYNSKLEFDTQFDKEHEFSKGEFKTHMSGFCGYAEITEDSLKKMGYTLTVGKLPDGSKDEIAISAAAYDTFEQAGYAELVINEDGEMDYVDTGTKTNPDGSTERDIHYTKITKPEDMIGKTLMLDSKPYTITGVIDTKLDLSRYARLKESTEHNTNADELVNYMLYSELNTALYSSMTGCAMVGAGKVQQMVDAAPKIYESDNGSVNLWNRTGESSDYSIYADYFTALSRVPESEIIWVDGKKDSLAPNEFIFTLDVLHCYSTTGDGVELGDENGNITSDDLKELLRQTGDWEGSVYHYDPDDYDNDRMDEVKLVGIIRPDSAYTNTLVCADSVMDSLVDDMDGVYSYAMGAMPQTRAEIEKFVRYCYRDGADVDVRYELDNAVTYELDAINGALKVLAKVFLYIGIGFAVFASLLMANFISQSISYKRQEIGILRAIGSRSNDVFRIFFSESFVIAMINFGISALACGIGVAVINQLLRKHVGILVTVLHFGIRQLALLLVISVAIAAIASFIPVQRIAAKKPIDAIRGR